MPWVLYETEL